MSQAQPFLGPVESAQRVRIRSILLATDFSPISELAFNYALAFAHLYDSRVTVAHVIRPEACVLVPPLGRTTTSCELGREFAEHEMTRLLVSGRLRSVPHQVVVEEGALWPVLSSVIRRNDVDLVVAGTHGRTGMKKMLLGSVAEEIFRQSDCPVLTVGPATGEVSLPIELKRILYATDFSPASEAALSYAVSLAQEYGSRLTMLHAVQDYRDGSAEVAAKVQESYAHQLQKMLPADLLWGETAFRVAFGEPVPAIQKIASAERSQLIVLGIQRALGFAGRLPTDKSYRIACQAPCPVLTVRSAE
jgi:nucleotide-binding universal stress UspA family protein